MFSKPKSPVLQVARRRTLRAISIIAAGLALYLAAAYLALPEFWIHHEHQPGLAHRPLVTVTSQGIPADPINVGLVGSETEVIQAMRRAGWEPADPITFRSSLRIGKSVLLDKAYAAAPVSSLFLDGQRQNLAFEKSEGVSARRRNHVRFWRVLERGVEGRPVWMGSASFDRGVGVSHYTGQVTHHIGPDLDAERDLLIDDLTKADVLQTIYQTSGVGPTLNGRNGEGDPYFTDGEVTIGVLRPGDVPQTAAPTTLSNPPAVVAKSVVWRVLAWATRWIYRVS
jgi:hypothetical protein